MNDYIPSECVKYLEQHIGMLAARDAEIAQFKQAIESYNDRWERNKAEIERLKEDNANLALVCQNWKDNYDAMIKAREL